MSSAQHRSRGMTGKPALDRTRRALALGRKRGIVSALGPIKVMRSWRSVDEVKVSRQQAIARMDRIRPRFGLWRHTDDLVDRTGDRPPRPAPSPILVASYALKRASSAVLFGRRRPSLARLVGGAHPTRMAISPGWRVRIFLNSSWRGLRLAGCGMCRMRTTGPQLPDVAGGLEIQPSSYAMVDAAQRRARPATAARQARGADWHMLSPCP